MAGPGPLLGRYRTEVMGLCIIGIVLYHMPLAPVATGQAAGWWRQALGVLKELGFLGVDVFFFVSGFGLMCSRQRLKVGYRTYIARRLRRIVPGYMAVVAGMLLLMAALGKFPSMLDVFVSLFLLDYFFLRDPQFWFASAILVCYAAFPIYAAALERSRCPERFTALACALAIMLACILAVQQSTTYLLVFAWRLPAFIFGVYAGLHASGECPSYPAVRHGVYRSPGSLRGHAAVMAISLVCFFAMVLMTTEGQRWRYGLWWAPFVFAAPSLAQLLAALSQWQDARAPRAAMGFVRLCGRHSYEIYLLHIALFDLFAGDRPIADTFRQGFWRAVGLGPYSPALLLVLACVALLLAPALHNISSRLSGASRSALA